MIALSGLQFTELHQAMLEMFSVQTKNLWISFHFHLHCTSALHGVLINEQIMN